MDKLLWMDGAVLLWIQDHVRNSFLTPIMQGITNLGNNGWFWIAMTLILLLIPRFRKIGLMSAAALILSLLINNIWLKNWIARIRPYEVVEGLKLITRKPLDYSFPSGHTSISLCAAVVYWRCSREYQKSGNEKFYFPMVPAWILLILAILISLSRLYVGVHFPTDVLGGAVTGVLIGWFVVEVYKRRTK